MRSGTRMSCESQDEFNDGDELLKQKSCATIRSNPMVLACSINQRVRPRHLLALSRGLRVNVSYLYQLNDAKFCEKIGKFASQCLQEETCTCL